MSNKKMLFPKNKLVAKVVISDNLQFSEDRTKFARHLGKEVFLLISSGMNQIKKGGEING